MVLKVPYRVCYSIYSCRSRKDYYAMGIGNVLNFYYAVLFSKRKLFGPQDFRLWSHIFLVLCVVALSLDPLFCYILLLNEDHNYLRLDRKLGTIAIVFRSIIDFFYILHIIFQFRSRIACLSSKVPEIRVEIRALPWRYFLFYSLVDILVILPLPQVLIFIIVPKLNDSRSLDAVEWFNSIVIFQYVIRVIRICSLLRKVTRTSRILAETAWANLFLYLLASHVVGAFWYLLTIERKATCWRQACKLHDVAYCSIYCDDNFGPGMFLDDSCSTDSQLFHYGIFIDALESGIVDTADFVQKISYCFWWGLRNLSSLGQGLQTSTHVWEIYFAAFVSISGLVLLSSLIGNMQTYLQLKTARLAEMRVKEQEREYCMAFYTLPHGLKKRIKKDRWREDIGLTMEKFFLSLPKDLRRDTKQYICLGALRRVPLFDTLDEQLLESMCDILKPVIYTKGSFIIREGDSVDGMFFIMRGMVVSSSIDGSFSVCLKAGDFCGEEIIAILDPSSSLHLPISTRTVQAITLVESFVLKADDFRSLKHNLRYTTQQWRALKHNLRFYSHQWRTWAACYIQAAWRRNRRKKLEESLRKEENMLQDALANAGGSSSSQTIGSAIYALRFAANALSAIRHNARPRPLQKPSEPDISIE